MTESPYIANVTGRFMTKEDLELLLEVLDIGYDQIMGQRNITNLEGEMLLCIINNIERMLKNG